MLKRVDHIYVAVSDFARSERFYDAVMRALGQHKGDKIIAGEPHAHYLGPQFQVMVVLIAGLNFLGYLLVKVLGNEHGLVLTGILGGLVSSTAVTLSFSQRSRREPAMSSAFVLAIVIAWTIMFLRVVVEVGVINRALAASLALALGCMAAAGLIVSLVLWRRSRAREKGVVTTGANPFELSEAIKFGLLFGTHRRSLEGTWEYTVEGKPPVTLKAGDVLFIPAETIHSARNVGTGRAAELATYIVEKGKPLLTLVK